MSTEQKPPATGPAPAPAAPAHVTHHEPKAEPNALASTLTNSWEQFKQGKLLSYPMMALILLVVAGGAGGYYILHSNRKVESAKWTAWDALGSVSSLEEYAKANPNTMQGRLATLDVARTQLGPEGIDRFSLQNKDERKKAVESVQKARDSFAKLADEFKDDTLLKTICLLGCAKAEAALVGMLKEGSLDQYIGDPKKAIEWLDKVAETAPDTDWGKDSKKLADTLRNQNTEQQVVTLQRSVYLIAAPSVPGFDPKSPFDPSRPPGGFGGLPPGFGGP